MARLRGRGALAAVLGGGGRVAARDHRLRPGPASRRLLGLLPVARPSRAGFPLLSMGRAPHGARTSSPAVRAWGAALAAPPGQGTAAVGHRRLAAAPAALQADVQLRTDEADLGRPHVARSHRPHVPLLDTAHPHAARLVCEPAAAGRADRILRRHVPRRGGPAFPDLRPPATTADRSLRIPGAPVAHRRYRELRILQPAVGGAVRVVARRPRLADGAADAPPGIRRARRRLTWPIFPPHSRRRRPRPPLGPSARRRFPHRLLAPPSRSPAAASREPRLAVLDQ